MIIWRSPSAMRSVTGCTRGLPSGDAAEDRTDRHAEARQVTLTENVAGHDFTGRENVGARRQSLYLASLIHFQPEIRKRDPGSQRVTEERRPVDGLGLV